jgi:hypothetical protein
MVTGKTLNAGNVTQFILNECNMLADMEWVFATVKNNEPKFCSLIQIFLFNMWRSLYYSYCNRYKVLFL